MQRIAVVDFGTGNLRSVSKALEHVAPDAEVIVTRAAECIDAADRVVLPGQGAMGSWLTAMRERQLEASIRRALKGVPVLGICLGMQALLEHSEEDGGTRGLGLFEGTVRKFIRPPASGHDFKIPHMGWNRVLQSREHPLWEGIEDGTRFYFVHSFHVDLRCADEIAGRTDYMIDFTSAIARGNVFAVQFHPEKSHTQGLRLLGNFVQWDGVNQTR